MTDETPTQPERPPRRLSPELIAILAVGVALGVGLGGLMIAGQQRIEARLLATEAAWQAESRQLREEARADRENFQHEILANETAWQAESRQLREEARADRENFQREILRLTTGQAELATLVKK